MQVRFLMLNTMCLTSLHNIQQDLINFIPRFSSLLMQMIFFLLLKQTVPNSDTRYFRASVIYMYTNPVVMYELMRIRHNSNKGEGKTRIAGSAILSSNLYVTLSHNDQRNWIDVLDFKT